MSQNFTKSVVPHFLKLPNVRQVCCKFEIWPYYISDHGQFDELNVVHFLKFILNVDQFVGRAVRRVCTK